MGGADGHVGHGARRRRHPNPRGTVSGNMPRIWQLLGHYLPQCKGAKIIVLHKPSKEEYSAPDPYRLVSLLDTFGKSLEAVVEKRLSYWAEILGILPDVQFTARSGRTAERAFVGVAELYQPRVDE